MPSGPEWHAGCYSVGSGKHHMAQITEQSEIAMTQGRLTTSKNPGCGTGLGRSMATTRAAKYGGRLDVASHIGRSTTFTIECPMGEQSKGGV